MYIFEGTKGRFGCIFCMLVVIMKPHMVLVRWMMVAPDGRARRSPPGRATVGRELITCHQSAEVAGTISTGIGSKLKQKPHKELEWVWLGRWRGEGVGQGVGGNIGSLLCRHYIGDTINYYIGDRRRGGGGGEGCLGPSGSSPSSSQ